MTIAVSVKVHDGLILAADSASTITPAGAPQTVVNVYNNANKVFNLYKGLPIGGITWGAGSIGHASIYTLAKDLRWRLSGRDSAHGKWQIDREAYTVEQIAESARNLPYDEMYVPLYGKAPVKPEMGFIVAGYSSGSDLPEEWQLEISAQGCPSPILIRPSHECGVLWRVSRKRFREWFWGTGPGCRKCF